LALKSGVDVSLWDDVYTRLPEAVERGLAPEALLDEAVERVLELKFRMGLRGAFRIRLLGNKGFSRKP
ncbi:MAG: hypothetical protein J5827_00695, partial [Oscillospiraceae bacterium]|nr:hypothetical protein [Oscillospiraceae bacterium]